MKVQDIIKNLILGFWRNGFISLCKTVLEHWIISALIIALIIYLCSDPKTAIYAWFLIGAFALYSAIRAIVEIIMEINNYIKNDDLKFKTLTL